MYSNYRYVKQYIKIFTEEGRRDVTIKHNTFEKNSFNSRPHARRNNSTAGIFDSSIPSCLPTNAQTVYTNNFTQKKASNILKTQSKANLPFKHSFVSWQNSLLIYIELFAFLNWILLFVLFFKDFQWQATPKLPSVSWSATAERASSRTASVFTQPSKAFQIRIV